MSWTDVGVNNVDVNDVGVKGWTGVGVKGCAMRRSLSPARCGFARWCRGVLVAGGVASMEWCPTRHVVVRRVLVRWSIPVYQAVVMSPCSSSRLKRPSVCSVRSCRSMTCWKTRSKVHVAGVPLSSVATDCRLRHSIVGCDDVGV